MIGAKSILELLRSVCSVENISDEIVKACFYIFLLSLKAFYLYNESFLALMARVSWQVLD